MINGVLFVHTVNCSCFLGGSTDVMSINVSVDR